MEPEYKDEVLEEYLKRPGGEQVPQEHDHDFDQRVLSRGVPAARRRNTSSQVLSRPAPPFRVRVVAFKPDCGQRNG